MGKIFCSGYSLSFVSRLSFVVIAVGLMSHKSALQEFAVENVTDAFVLGDSPVWMDKTLWFIDGYQRQLIRYQLNTEPPTVAIDIKSGPLLKFIVPSGSGAAVFVVGTGSVVGIISWDGSSTDTIVPGNNLWISRDPLENVVCGKADIGSRLWVGTSFSPNGVDLQGRLYMVESDGTITRKIDNVGVPGDVAWSEDDSWLYYSDTSANTIVGHPFYYSYEAKTGDLVKETTGEVVFDFNANKVTCKPKGMTIDIHGKLWVACKDSPSIVKIDPKSRTLLTTVNFPEANSITSVVFGGTYMNDLYVTTAGKLPPDLNYPKAGTLFRVTNTNSTGIYTFGCNASWPET